MLALFIVAGVIGCASAGTTGATRANPNIITQQELAQAEGMLAGGRRFAPVTCAEHAREARAGLRIRG